jgi:hypothetical protein
MFDISSMALKSEAYTFQLKHPVAEELLFAGDESKPVTISVYGSASKPYRDAVAQLQQRGLKRKTAKGKVDPEKEIENLKEESLNMLVACSATSTNLAYQGEPVTSAAQFKKMYADPGLSWIRDQVDAEIGNAENFLGK